MKRATRRRTLGIAGASAVALIATTMLTGCGGSSASGAGDGSTLRLGYFPNLTHASALVGVQKGYFAKELGSGVKLKTQTFNAGDDAVQALFSGALDASYVGPNPTINAYVKSHGDAVRVISGATSGGAALVVKPSITSIAQLKGKKIASPALGNTQDVALRYFLSKHGLKADKQGGGDVHITPQKNAQTLQAFAAGAIDGAWVPEPYATQLQQTSGGKVLVNEKSQWPGGKFVTTQLIVRTEYLKAHPDVVKNLIKGQDDANSYLQKDPAQAQAAVNAGLKSLTGKEIKPAVIKAAWKNLQFTDDPIASSLRSSAGHAVSVGLLKKVDLGKLYDLGPLNSVLKARSEKEIPTS